MTTLLIIFYVSASLALLSQVGVAWLPEKGKKPMTAVGILLHVAVFPLFPYLGFSMTFCLSFYLLSALMRFAPALVKRKGERHDL